MEIYAIIIMQQIETMEHLMGFMQHMFPKKFAGYHAWFSILQCLESLSGRIVFFSKIRSMHVYV